MEAGILDEGGLMQKQSLREQKMWGVLGGAQFTDDYGPHVDEIFDLNAEEAVVSCQMSY